MAASSAVSHLSWLQRASVELTVPEDAIVYIDNKNSIDLIYNHRATERSKHIDVKYHYIRERYLQKTFKLEYIPFIGNLADVFTKSFGRIIQQRLLEVFMD